MKASFECMSEAWKGVGFELFIHLLYFFCQYWNKQFYINNLFIPAYRLNFDSTLRSPSSKIRVNTVGFGWF